VPKLFIFVIAAFTFGGAHASEIAPSSQKAPVFTWTAVTAAFKASHTPLRQEVEGSWTAIGLVQSAYKESPIYKPDGWNTDEKGHSFKIIQDFTFAGDNAFSQPYYTLTGTTVDKATGKTTNDGTTAWAESTSEGILINKKKVGDRTYCGSRIACRIVDTNGALLCAYHYVDSVCLQKLSDPYEYDAFVRTVPSIISWQTSNPNGIEKPMTSMKALSGSGHEGACRRDEIRRGCKTAHFPPNPFPREACFCP
jgi:hypothetical protein